MNHLVTAQYRDFTVNFTDDGWVNATAAVERFGKRIDKYLENDDTKEYIAALCENPNTPKRGDLIRTKRGHAGGTWLHPDLAVHFARWLDVRFSIWCDRQIRSILVGTHPHHTWQRLRHQAASSFKVMNGMLQLVREQQGKVSKPYHFMNEAKLVNGVLTGEFAGADRESMTVDQLDLLAQVEQRSAVLIGCGLPYVERKKLLSQFVATWRHKHPANIEYQATA